MASRSGGYRIKTNKVRSGPDQTFTLPKGTSAAPVKGKGMGIPQPKPKGKTAASAKRFIARRQQLAGTKNKTKSQLPTAREIAVAVAAYLAGSNKTTKAKKTKKKTLAQIESTARKARDKKAKFERLKKDPRSTGIKAPLTSLLKKKR